MAQAAEIFNPIFLSTMRDIDIVLELHTHADKLEHFGFTRHFTPDFIKQLKSEMPAVVKEACRDH
eukprot:13140662-Ditylum_brightwellii.AAC.1